MGNASGTLQTSDDISEFNFLNNKLTHGYNLFIKDSNARDVFIDYIKNGTWVDAYLSNNYTDNDDTKEDLIDTKTSESYQEYIIPSTSSNNFNHALLKFKESGDHKYMEEVIETCFTQSSLRNILLASIFPLFVNSKEYKQWIQELTDDENTDTIGRSKRLDDLFQPSQTRVRDIIKQAISVVDENELNLMLMSGDWLQNLLATVEELPLCVSLATARTDRPGFPLIYVNKAFEKTTQFSRSEIIGHNCKFLQSNHSEPDQIMKLSYALKHAKPVKVALTNVRKDGSEFMNFLAMKPIFDEFGVYSYVIGK